jgi:hypothetical protein
MSTSISGSRPAAGTTSVRESDASSTPAAKPRSTESVTQTPSATDIPKETVHLSDAARALLNETTETPAETAKEARQGDRQAKHLLAKQAAAKAAASSPPVHVVS